MRQLQFDYLYVLSVPYVAAISSITLPDVGGFHYTGYLWSLLLAIGVLLILHRRRTVAFPWQLWFPWFGYVVLSLAWGGIHWLPNVQDPAQMITPLIVGIVASFAVRTEAQLEKMMRAFVYCLALVAFVFVFFWYGPGAPYQADGSGYCVRPAAMTMAFIGCLFVARSRKTTLASLLGWLTCLAVTVLSGSRMATVVLLTLWLIAPLYRHLRSRVLVAGAMCLAALALFYSPIFQERFFPSGDGGSLTQVVQGDYDGAGRFEVWPVVWQEAQKNLVFGAGAGEVGRFAERAQIPLSLSRPCNDFLRVIFEYGILGLVILVITVLRQMWLLYKLRRISRNPGVTWALAASFLGFAATMMFASTENVLVYGVYFMHPLFAITGAAIGLTVREQYRAQRETVRATAPLARGWTPAPYTPWTN